MSEVLEGDEWKRQREPQQRIRRLTRAELQTAINRDYAEGRLELEDWRALTEELSEPKVTKQ